mgnify:CR=1 FL=1
MITNVGYSKLKLRLNELNIERRELMQEMREVKENCLSSDDTSELNQYRMSLDGLEDNIEKISNAIENSRIIDVKTMPTDKVRFGHKVVVEDLDTGEQMTVKLVSIYESDPKNGLISISSPLGQALSGMMLGDIVDFVAPNGDKELEILSIETMDDVF